MYEPEEYIEEEMIEDVRDGKYREELVDSGEMEPWEAGFSEGYYDYDEAF